MQFGDFSVKQTLVLAEEVASKKMSHFTSTLCSLILQEKIFAMFRELFGAACSKGPPFGIPPSPQSRSMYAVDLMLDWDTTDSGKHSASHKVV